MGTNSSTPRRWRQWTEDEARAALQELAATGESRAGFARRRGVSTQRIAYWSKRFARRRSTAAGQTDFVAVRLPVTPSTAWIEIAASRVVVRVREDLDVDHVARLVEAIGRRTTGAC